LLGLALPRFGGSVGVEAFASEAAVVETDRSTDLAGLGSAADSDEEATTDRDAAIPGFAAPVALAIDAAAVLQRTTESPQRPQLELDWAKFRGLLSHARHEAHRLLVAGDPVRVAERAVASQASPLLRWRLAHSTSSAIG